MAFPPHLNVHSKYLVYITGLSREIDDWPKLKKLIAHKYGHVKFVESFEAWRGRQIGKMIIEFNNFPDSVDFATDILRQKVDFLPNVDVKHIHTMKRSAFFQLVLLETEVDLLECDGQPPTLKALQQRRHARISTNAKPYRTPAPRESPPRRRLSLLSLTDSTHVNTSGSTPSLPRVSPPSLLNMPNILPPPEMQLLNILRPSAQRRQTAVNELEAGLYSSRNKGSSSRRVSNGQGKHRSHSTRQVLGKRSTNRNDTIVISDDESSSGSSNPLPNSYKPAKKRQITVITLLDSDDNSGNPQQHETLEDYEDVEEYELVEDEPVRNAVLSAKQEPLEESVNAANGNGGADDGTVERNDERNNGILGEQSQNENNPSAIANGQLQEENVCSSIRNMAISEENMEQSPAEMLADLIRDVNYVVNAMEVDLGDENEDVIL